MSDLPAPLAIKRAIRDLIAGMVPPVVPTTPLQEFANVGDPVVICDPLLTADGVPRFQVGGRLGFYDGTNEYNLPIKAIETSATQMALTLNLDGMLIPGSGLLSSHDIGTPVYSNLTAYYSRSAGIMVNRGDPVVCVTVLEHRGERDGFGFGHPVYHAVVVYLRRVDRLNQTMDADVFAEQQEDSTLADMSGSIHDMLLANQELRTQWADPCALQFAAFPGVTGDKDPIFTKYSWKADKDEVGVLLFAATMQINVVALAETLSA